MSLILDALKRSERERTGDGESESHVDMGRLSESELPSRARTLAIALVFSILLLGGAIGFKLMLGDDHAVETVASAPPIERAAVTPTPIEPAIPPVNQPVEPTGPDAAPKTPVITAEAVAPAPLEPANTLTHKPTEGAVAPEPAPKTLGPTPTFIPSVIKEPEPPTPAPEPTPPVVAEPTRPQPKSVEVPSVATAIPERQPDPQPKPGAQAQAETQSAPKPEAEPIPKTALENTVNAIPEATAAPVVAPPPAFVTTPKHPSSRLLTVRPARKPVAPARPNFPPGPAPTTGQTPETHVQRAQAFEQEGRFDRAIDEYTQAILLRPDYWAAYFGRGWAHASNGAHANAVRSFTDAVRLKPDFADAFVGRAWAHEQAGAYDSAMNDYSAAIRVAPGHVDAHLSRGILRLYADLPNQAATDFVAIGGKGSAELNDYALLWSFLAHARADGSIDKARTALAGRTSRSRWPGILFALLMGQTSPDDVLSAMRDGDRLTQKKRECVGHFYLGQQRLLEGDRTSAITHFRKAVASGITGFRQYWAAEQELKRLGVKP